MASRILFVVYDNGSYDNEFPMGVGALSAVLKEQGHEIKMSETFKFDLITPERSILSTETTEVIIPAFEGQMTVLKDHIPIITFLKPGIITFLESSNSKNYLIDDGTVEFKNNYLLILTENAIDLEKFDKSSAPNIINKLESEILQNQISDKEKFLISSKIETLKEISR